MVSHRMRRSIVIGIAAYLIGYVIFYAVATIDEGLTWSVLRESIGSAGLAGWAYYSAHFVGMSAEAPTFLGESINLLQEAPPETPVLVLYLVPVALLLLAGAVNALADDDFDRQATNHAAYCGAVISNGYAVAAILGAVVFTYEETVLVVDIDVAPDIGYTLLMMAFLYPIVIGGIGGALAKLLVSRGG